MKRSRWITGALAAVQFAALAVGATSSPALAADTIAPKILRATMVDSDSDDRADRIVLTYNEPIRHALDGDGHYPFSLTQPSYSIRRINGASNTKQLVVLINEKPAPDPGARPRVTYERGVVAPVRDRSGNQARNQIFKLTMPLPCPQNSTNDFYANPVVNRTATPAPTGVSSPAWCAFPTLTAALGAAWSKGPPARVIATGASTTPAAFGKETFPLTIPGGITLTTDDEVGGGGLDPMNYLVHFKGSASRAVHLLGGDMRGITVDNSRSLNATSMVVCGPGSSEMRGIALDGLDTLGGSIDTGLLVEDGCTLTDGLAEGLPSSLGLRSRNFAGTGIKIADGGTLSLTSPVVHHNGGDGIWAQGEADLNVGKVAFNGDDGIFMDQSTSSSVLAMEIRDNTSNGLEVFSSEVSVYGNMIFNNSRIETSPFTNAAPQIFYRGAAPSGLRMWSGTQCVSAYAFGYGLVDNCNDDGPIDAPSPDCLITNVVVGYSLVDPSIPTVGMRAEDNAVVNAQGNEWASSTSSQNVNQGAGSFINADFTCGTRGTPLSTANDPVE